MINDEMISFNEINIILDHTIEGILILEKGFISNVNTSVLNILGYKDKNDLIGNLASGCLIPSIKEKYIAYNNEIFQEISLLSKDGKIIPALIKIIDINIQNKEFKMVSILDLRELKKKEALILKQSRLAAMGEMIAMISHQWKQPLMAISIALTNIKFKILKNNLNTKFLEKKLIEIDTYLQYTSNTINDFNNFYKNDKIKKMSSFYEIVNIVYKMLSPTFLSNGIEIKIKEQNLSKLLLYENELIQVVINIINNSSDAFLERKIKNAKINISFFEDKNVQTIYIEDNAKGIENEIIDKIFDPYFSTKKDLNGTGLGLYMSKMILEKEFKGNINVKNTEQGCIFSLSINKYN